MAGPTEHLGLQLDADAKAWDASFKQAEKSAASLGSTVNKATTKTGAFGGALGQAGAKGTDSFGKLTKTADDAAKKMDALGGKAKEQASIWDGLTKKIVSAELVTKAAGLAFKAAGDYLKGAFERAKIDPALAAVNELRMATEGWTLDIERGLDRLLNKGAKVITTLAHGLAVREVEGALLARARQRGTTVDAERQRYVDDEFRSGFALGAYGGTDEGKSIAGQLFNSGAGGGSGGGVGDLFGKLTRAGRGAPRDTSPGAFAGVGDIFGYFGSVGRQGSAQLGRGIGTLYPGTGSPLGGLGDGLGQGGGGVGDMMATLTEAPDKLAVLKDALSAVNDSVAATIGATLAAGAAGERAALREGAAKLKATAVVEGVLAIANFWNPTGATHAAAAAAALAGMAALGVLGGGIGGGTGASPRSLPGGGFANARPDMRGDGDATNITVNVHGWTGTTAREAVAAISEGLEEGLAARRIRDPYLQTRVPRYEEAT